jgi:preprotein translocase subunit SecF
MEFFRVRRDIPFMKHALALNAFSTLAFVLAVFFLVTRGLNLSVEFTGGTVMEVAYEQPADLGAVRRSSRVSVTPRCRCRTSAPRATCCCACPPWPA